MATAQTTIRDALRLCRRIGFDGNPTSMQSENHLRDLNRWLKRIYDQTRYPYLDLYVTSSGELSAYDQSVRMNVEASSGLTVTLPSNPVDGACIQVICTLGSLASTPLTLDPNGVLFEGDDEAASITAAGVWRFRGDIADWRQVETLAIGDELPFPEEFDDHLIAAFAKRISGGYGPGARLSPDDDALARNCIPTLRKRYVKPRPVIQEAAVRNIGRGAYDGTPWTNPWGSSET